MKRLVMISAAIWAGCFSPGFAQNRSSLHSALSTWTKSYGGGDFIRVVALLEGDLVVMRTALRDCRTFENAAPYSALDFQRTIVVKNPNFLDRANITIPCKQGEQCVKASGGIALPKLGCPVSKIPRKDVTMSSFYFDAVPLAVAEKVAAQLRQQ